MLRPEVTPTGPGREALPPLVQVRDAFTVLPFCTIPLDKIGCGEPGSEIIMGAAPRSAKVGHGKLALRLPFTCYVENRGVNSISCVPTFFFTFFIKTYFFSLLGAAF